jgi:hypothetical protein
MVPDVRCKVSTHAPFSARSRACVAPAHDIARSLVPRVRVGIRGSS